MNNYLAKVIRNSVNKIGIDIVKYYPSSFNSSFPKDFEDDCITTIEKVKPFTMTSKERLYALCEAVKYVVRNNIPGDIVECGVWKGGSMMAIANTLITLKDESKNLYLFDTFDGMSEPTDKDIAINGSSAEYLMTVEKKEEDLSLWCYSPIEDVKSNVHSIGYPSNKIHFIQGKVENTIPEQSPSNISLLRLDTDWYESTHHEMVHLFPRLSFGGVLIIDDYGWWEGARKAVDEYIYENNIQILLNRIDYTGRIGIKTSDGHKF
jgi:O-methyltransferase